LLLGHKINDSNSFNIEPECGDTNKIKNVIGKYLLNSKNNAKIKRNEDKSIIYIVAIKDIQKDEEILISYDVCYWLKTVYNLNVFYKMLQTDKNFFDFVNKYTEID
jgi:SET domain-containing protein